MNRVQAVHARSAATRTRRVLAAAVATVSLLASAGQAVAAGQACYSRAEHAAEQTIRMHTELMVIGLTCQGLSPAADPFGKYQDFTIKHRSFLSAQEAVMISHFRKHAKGNATRNFDSFRTELANDISRRAAIVGNHVYCWNYVDRAKAAMQLSQADVKALTSDEKGAGLMHLSSKPLCDVKVVSTPDPVYNVAAVPADAAKATAKPTAKPTATAKTDAKAKSDAKATTTAAKPTAKPAGKPAPEKAAAKPPVKPTSDKVAANVKG